jgi:pimeloyl-ACP methyl ester carboxylesterase
MRLARKLLLRVLLVVFCLLVLSAAAAAAYDAAVPFRTSPPQALYGGPFVRLDGRLVAYRQWGAHGSPIVLIPGFAEASFVFERVGPLLAARGHRVYAVDLAGYGYSERKGPYGLAGWTAQVRAFLQHFGLERPLLVGHSLGAAVAVSVAADVPVRGVVLADGDALSEGGAPAVLRQLVVEPYRTAAFRLVLGSDWAVRRILQAAYGPLHPRLTHAEVERWRRPFHVQGTETALWSMTADGIPGFTLAELRRTRLHALVLWGSEDTTDPLGAGRRSARALRAPLVLLPGAGHLSMLVLPAEFARAVARFDAAG